MTHRDNDSGWWTKTGLTCDHDGCEADMMKYTTSGSRKCTEGHKPQKDICDDCGEEVMEHPRLGKICGCD